MKIKGKLELYFETGMEGCEWAVFDEKYQEGKNPYDFLYELQNGDKLKVYQDGKLEWQGRIKKDLKTNLTNKTGYPYPRQVVQNYIVHWLQKGIDPDKWAKMFFEHKECELERKVRNK